ncbi:TetR/AcrR family transcriptional regulator [Chitinophaga solisilvae]|uniref:TetR/AcrR family transcriptional regulator n=1 Tax=Chitinophaga solisilvae TaxID=1233460 RepID=UPI001369A1D5|nr:TetR/AcrR family transcriptional regulator [Chitinophaga solisilvae]
MKHEYHHFFHTAAALFLQKGIRAVSIDEIAQNCRFSTTVFFEHFDSKEKLVALMVAEWVEKADRYLSLNRHMAANAIAELKQLLCAAEKIVETTSTLFLRDLKHYYPASWMRLEVFKEESFSACLLQNLHRGQQEDLYRSNIDRSVITAVYMAQLRFMTEERFTPRNDFHQVYGEVNRLFLYGLANRKGRRVLVFD